MSEEFEDERGRWDDEGYRTREEGWRQSSDRDDDDRSFKSRNTGYPGSFEDRYRDGGWQDRSSRGYGFNDGDRPNLGTGGTQHTGYSRGDLQPERPVWRGFRGKGPIGYQRSDERIRELVCEALTDDDRVDATNVEVDVRNGEVILTGAVDDRQQKRAAEDCIEHIRGVKDIQNQIRVMGDRRRY